MTRKADYTISSGNVFADMGCRNADELLVKSGLISKISSAIEARGLSQTQAAQVLGIDQPKVSALLRGQLSGFSVERLIRFLILLGQDVKIIVKPRPRSRSQAHARVA